MEIRDRVERINHALEPLVAELLDAGVRLNDARDIHFLHKDDYIVGLPIILAHLHNPYDDVVKAVISGALDYTKNTHSLAAWPEIAALYSKHPNTAKPFDDSDLEVGPSLAKLILANALLRLYQPSRLATLIDLVRDQRNGETRIILLEPLLRVKNRRKGMMDLLRGLKADPELGVELTAKGIL